MKCCAVASTANYYDKADKHNSAKKRASPDIEETEILFIISLGKRNSNKPPLN